MTLFIAYATISASNPQNPPWYLNVLLVLSIGAAVVCVIAGGIWLFRLIFGKKLEIDIHDSESKSKITNQGNKYKFEIAYVLKTSQPPFDIARINLHIQSTKLKSTEQPFKLDNTKQAHVSTFESVEDTILSHPLKNEDRYYLSIFALDRDWKSKEFKLDKSGVSIDVPAANIGYGVKVLAIHTEAKLEIEVGETDVISSPGLISLVDPKDEVIAITTSITLIPNHKMQWAKISLDYGEGVLEGRVNNVEMPHYLECAETHDVIFDIKNKAGEGSYFAALWYIKELRKNARGEPRTQGIITMVADGKEWKSSPFSIPTKIKSAILKSPDSKLQVDEPDELLWYLTEARKSAQALSKLSAEIEIPDTRPEKGVGTVIFNAKTDYANLRDRLQYKNLGVQNKTYSEKIADLKPLLLRGISLLDTCLEIRSLKGFKDEIDGNAECIAKNILDIIQHWKQLGFYIQDYPNSRTVSNNGENAAFVSRDHGKISVSDADLEGYGKIGFVDDHGEIGIDGLKAKRPNTETKDNADL